MLLELSRIFVKVVQNTSFTKAGIALNVPKSTVSKSISRLEKELNTKLLLRTTRNITLTPAGLRYYEALIEPMQALEEAHKSIYGNDSLLSGHLKITAPEDLGANIIAPVIAQLAREHSGLSFELIYTEKIINLIQDGFDLAIRVGHISESNLKFRNVGKITLIPVASPFYLQNSAPIIQPQDFTHHNCLCLAGFNTNNWALKSFNKRVKISIQPKISCNTTSSLLKLVLASGGIALLPSFLVNPEIEIGSLIRLCPEWTTEDIPVSLLSPLAPSSSARLKITVDRILLALKNVL